MLPLPPTASAMEAVDFQEAVTRALSNNAVVQAAGEETIAAQKDVDAARGYLLPSVRFGDKFVRTTVPAEAFALKMDQEKLLASDFANVSNFNSPPPRNDFIATLSLEQPLFAPKAYIGYGMAKVEANAKSQDLYRRKEDAVYRVVTALLDVITARQFVEVADQGLSDTREHLRIAREPRGGGDGTHLRCVAGERGGRLRGKREGDGGEPAGDRAPQARPCDGRAGCASRGCDRPAPGVPRSRPARGERGKRKRPGRPARLVAAGCKRGEQRPAPAIGIPARRRSRGGIPGGRRGFPLLSRQPLLDGGCRAHLDPLRRDAPRGGGGKGRSGAPSGAGVRPRDAGPGGVRSRRRRTWV